MIYKSCDLNLNMPIWEKCLPLGNSQWVALYSYPVPGKKLTLEQVLKEAQQKGNPWIYINGLGYVRVEERRG